MIIRNKLRILPIKKLKSEIGVHNFILILENLFVKTQEFYESIF